MKAGLTGSAPVPAGPAAIRIELAPAGEWDDLVAELPGYTVFHGSGWLDAVADVHGLELLRAVARSGDACVGAWPLLARRVGPFRILGSPLPGWSTIYLGPLFRDDADPDRVLEAFLADPRIGRASYLYTKVCDAHRPIDLARCGFERQHRFRTYLVDLQRSEEEIWAGLARRCRSAVRKARRAGLTVVREADLDYVDDFWRMSVEVFARSGIRPSYSRRLVERVVEGLTARGELFVMSVMLDGKRLSTQILPYDDRAAYAWGAASFSEYRHLSLSNVLDWETILEARRLGLRHYDLVSVYGGPGLYKKSFGAEDVAVATHWERYGSASARMGKRAYQAFLRWRQRSG